MGEWNPNLVHATIFGQVYQTGNALSNHLGLLISGHLYYSWERTWLIIKSHYQITGL